MSNSLKVFLVLLLAVILFHFSILLKIIPYDIAWGGRLESDTAMYFFESISILVNLFLGTVLLMKGDLISWKFSDKVIRGILWFFFVLFVLNTIGNILAKTNFEKFFAVLTGLSAFLVWNIVTKKKAS